MTVSNSIGSVAVTSAFASSSRGAKQTSALPSFFEPAPISDPLIQAPLKLLSENVRKVIFATDCFFRDFDPNWSLQKTRQFIKSVFVVQRQLKAGELKKLDPSRDFPFHRIVEKGAFHVFRDNEVIGMGSNKLVFDIQSFSTRRVKTGGKFFSPSKSERRVLYGLTQNQDVLTQQMTLMNDKMSPGAPVVRILSTGKMGGRFVGTSEKYTCDFSSVNFTIFSNPIEEFISAHVQCLEALSYLHNHNLIHRDVKAANFGCNFLDGHIKVLLADNDSLMEKPKSIHRTFCSYLYADPEEYGAPSDVCMNMKKRRGMQSEKGDVYAYATMVAVETFQQLMRQLAPLSSASEKDVHMKLGAIEECIHHQFNEIYADSGGLFTENQLTAFGLQYPHRVVFYPAAMGDGQESILAWKSVRKRYGLVKKVIDLFKGYLSQSEHSTLLKVVLNGMHALNPSSSRLSAAEYASDLRKLMDPDNTDQNGQAVSGRRKRLYSLFQQGDSKEQRTKKRNVLSKENNIVCFGFQ